MLAVLRQHGVSASATRRMLAAAGRRWLVACSRTGPIGGVLRGAVRDDRLIHIHAAGDIRRYGHRLGAHRRIAALPRTGAWEGRCASKGRRGRRGRRLGAPDTLRAIGDVGGCPRRPRAAFRVSGGGPAAARRLRPHEQTPPRGGGGVNFTL